LFKKTYFTIINAKAQTQTTDLASELTVTIKLATNFNEFLSVRLSVRLSVCLSICSPVLTLVRCVKTDVCE